MIIQAAIYTLLISLIFSILQRTLIIMKVPDSADKERPFLEYATVTAESKPENNKYVYVLAIGSGSECSAVSFDVLGVFTSIDSAKENFNERRAAELPIVKDNGWEIYDDSDFYFDAGKDGYYDSNHITISLTKLKLQN